MRIRLEDADPDPEDKKNIEKTGSWGEDWAGRAKVKIFTNKKRC